MFPVTDTVLCDSLYKKQELNKVLVFLSINKLKNVDILVAKNDNFII